MSDAAAFDLNVERLKACEHIAEGDDGWQSLSNLCPSTTAVANLRESLIDCAMALAAVLDIAREAHAAWDADEDSRVGKLLIALCDPSLKYRAEITAIHETKGRVDALLNGSSQADAAENTNAD
jgi:hypothetical protein